MVQTPCYVYDFTHKYCEETDEYDFDLLKSFLDTFTKKWCFQLEKGETTGYLHYQGRFHLIKKDRISGILKKYRFTHLSITSSNCSNDFNYVEKNETRVKGPWFSQNIENDINYQYIPRQIREISNLYPWQETIIQMSKEWDSRNINIIIDQVGNNGKTILKTYMGVHKLGRSVPFVNDYKDIMRIIYCLPTSNCYLFDFPRAINKERMFGLFSGIEDIKNGYCWDDRYSFKERYFDCPNIFVFTNTFPDISMLSNDRWRFWTINPETKVLETISRYENHFEGGGVSLETTPPLEN